MKLPGIVGGIGPESTIVYYRRLIAAYRERVPDGSWPRLLVHSVDNTKVLGPAAAGRFDELTDFLVEAVGVLARGGADFAVIAANTPHVVFDAVQDRSPIPLLSIVEETCRAARERGFRNFALFGTRPTMGATFYAETFARSGLTVVAPTAAEQEVIHARYVGELLHGIVRDETRQELLAIARRMAEREGTEAVILGGTELALILAEPEADGIPILDTCNAHVAAILREMLDSPA